MRLGILTSHPIQYQAPWFRALAGEADVQVFFAHQPGAAQQGEGFGQSFQWDVDLLAGYQHTFLKNVSRNPGASHFSGCNTPEIASIISPNSKLETRNSKLFDALIVNGWHLKCYWQAVRACRRAGVPVFVRGDSQLLTPRSRLKTWIKEVTYRVLLRQFDGFLVVGQRNAAYLAHYGVPAAKMFLVPHFVDNGWFREKADIGSKQRAEIRNTWGAGEKDFVALFTGKFISKKRPADLLQAMVKLKAHLTPSLSRSDAERVEVKPGEGTNILAVFVGSGELEKELRVLAAQENLRVHFAGFKNQSELPACYAAADVLVLPSDGGETWGLVVNEAMACGLPAIVSDAVGCAPDLIEAGRTGFTFPLGDVTALADRLSRISKMRQQGWDFSADLKRKMADYSIESAVQGTLKAVSALRPPTSAR